MCAGTWVLRNSLLRDSTFVRRRVGFKLFYGLGFNFLCAGTWVLRDFVLWDSTFVRRRVGFERFYVLGFDFCAQARGF